MPLNPYEHFTGSRDPLTIIESTAAKFAALYAEMQPEDMTVSPAPGKWSFRDILCHLADTEIAFGFRLRQTLAEPGHLIQPFNQELWSAPYSGLTASDALAAFDAMRKWNILLIKASTPLARQNKVTHPERGEMTFETIVETMAGHDLNHLSGHATSPGEGA